MPMSRCCGCSASSQIRLVIRKSAGDCRQDRRLAYAISSTDQIEAWRKIDFEVCKTSYVVQIRRFYAQFSAFCHRRPNLVENMPSIGCILGFGYPIGGF